MADLTLYTMADPEIIAAALTGVAMVFDPANTNAWVSDTATSNGFGLGAVAGVGLLITLGIILFKTIMTQKLEIGTILIMIVVYSIAFVPKTTLQVERLQDGAIEIVDDIPYGVALPAALMSGMMKSVTETFEIAFSDPRMGTYTETGFMDPLKSLMNMRDITRGSGNSLLKDNLSEYIKYCTVSASTGDESNLEKFLKKHGGWAQLFDPANIQGGMVRLKTATGTSNMSEGYFSCKNTIGSHPSAADYMKSLIETYTSSTTPTSANDAGLEADLIRAGGLNEYSPGKKASDVIKDSITTLVGNSTVNQDVVMTDLVTGSLLRDVGSSHAFSDPNSLLASLMMTESMEKFAVDAAGSGSMFLKTMTHSMDIMLFVWIALAPIVAMTMIISGLSGLKMLAQYFMFGVWTQSWMPFAMVINFYMQITISNTLDKKLLTGGSVADIFAPGMQVDLYRELAGTITAGSTLLAYTPILSLAVLSGSYFALSQLGTAMSGKDGYVDEKKLAPDAGQATGGTQAASYAQQNMSAIQKQTALEGGGAAMTGLERTGGMDISSVTATAKTQAVQFSNDRALSATKDAARQDATNFGMSLMNDSAHAEDRVKGTSYAKSLQEAGAVVSAWEKDNKVQLTNEERNAMKVAVAAGLHYKSSNGGKDGDKEGGTDITNKLIEQASKGGGVLGKVAEKLKNAQAVASLTGSKESSEGQTLSDSVSASTKNAASRTRTESGSKTEADARNERDTKSNAFKEDEGFRRMVMSSNAFRDARTQKESESTGYSVNSSASVSGPSLNTSDAAMRIKATNGSSANGVTYSAGAGQAAATGALMGDKGLAANDKFQRELEDAKNSGGVLGMLNKAAQWAKDGDDTKKAIGYAALGAMLQGAGDENIAAEGRTLMNAGGEIAARDNTAARIAGANADIPSTVSNGIAGANAEISQNKKDIQTEGNELKGAVAAKTSKPAADAAGARLMAGGTAAADTYKDVGAGIYGGGQALVEQIASAEDGVHSGGMMNRMRATLSQADEAGMALVDGLQGGYYKGKESVLGALSSVNGKDAAVRSKELAALQAVQGMVNEKGGWDKLSPQEQHDARSVMSTAGAGDYRMKNGEMLQGQELLTAAIDGKRAHITGAMNAEEDNFRSAVQAGKMSEEEFASAQERLTDAKDAFLNPAEFLDRQSDEKRRWMHGAPIPENKQ